MKTTRLAVSVIISLMCVFNVFAVNAAEKYSQDSNTQYLYSADEAPSYVPGKFNTYVTYPNGDVLAVQPDPNIPSMTRRAKPSYVEEEYGGYTAEGESRFINQGEESWVTTSMSGRGAEYLSSLNESYYTASSYCGNDFDENPNGTIAQAITAEVRASSLFDSQLTIVYGYHTFNDSELGGLTLETYNSRSAN